MGSNTVAAAAQHTHADAGIRPGAIKAVGLSATRTQKVAKVRHRAP